MNGLLYTRGGARGKPFPPPGAKKGRDRPTVADSRSIGPAGRGEHRLGAPLRAIGFVSHIPPSQDCVRSVRFALRGGRRPSELASFCTIDPPDAGPASPNWLCSALQTSHLRLQTPSQLGLFCTIGSGQGAARPPDTPGRPTLALFRIILPPGNADLRIGIMAGIGFVSHILLSALAVDWRN